MQGKKAVLYMMSFLGLLMFFASPVFGASSDCSELTSAQRFIGLVTFGNVMLTAGILGVVGFLIWLCYLTRIPAALYEVVGYAASIGLMSFANKILIGIDPAFIAFAGCIGFGAMLYVSHVLHDWKGDKTGYFMTLAVAWAITAMGYQSELIGFFSVAALFGALGFFVQSYPFMTVIGFKDDDSLNRATGAAFILLSAFVGYRIADVAVPFVGLFAYGAYLIGSLVGFTGLLILAYQGYEESGQKYLVRQIPIIVGGIAALFFGSVLAIPEIQKIGGTFLGLYILEKICDVPSEEKVGFVVKGLIISAIVLAVGYIILRNKEFFSAYILMM